jgi:hypothetical protein
MKSAFGYGNRRNSATAGEIVLRLIVAGGLAYSAYVHYDLHTNYSHNGSSITQGDIFVAQAVAASVAAALVLFVGRAVGWITGFLVATGSFAAVMVYRYVNVGKIGPLPNMYEPIWFTEKSDSAIAEAVAAALSLLVLVALAGQARKRRPTLTLPR